MKTFKLLLFSLAVLSTALFFSRCSLNEDIAKITDSLDSLQIIVGTPEFNTGVHIEFVDARTEEIIEKSDVSVTVSGKDAGMVYNNIGSKQESYKSNWGVLDLVIDPHKTDSASLLANPIQFEVTALLAGYSSETLPVTIYDTSIQTMRIPLINISNPPDGVAFIEKEVAVNTSVDGSLSDDVVIEFSGLGQRIVKKMKGQNSSSNVTPILILPKGIKFKYINEPIKSLNVNAQIINFPENGMITYPNKWLVDLFNGGYRAGYMNAYSSVSLKIEATTTNNQKRTVSATYNGFLTLQLILPNNYIDPLTMLPVKENDVIDRFSFKGSKFVKDPIKKINGKFVVESLLDESNLYLPLYYGKALSACTQSSKSSIVFDFDIDNIRKNGQGTLDYGIITTKENKYISRGSTSIGYWKIIEKQLGTLTEGSAKVVFNGKGKLKFTPDTLRINSMCENKKYYVGVESATANSDRNWIKLNLDLSVKSESNNNYIIKPSMTLYYGTLDFSAVNLKNGKASFTVMEGSVYNLRAALGNTKAQGNFKIEYDSPSTYKVIYTQQLSYNSTAKPVTIIVPKTNSNEVTLKYEFLVSDDVLNNFK